MIRTILCSLALMLWAAAVHAENDCIQPAEHDRLAYLLIDRSDTLHDAAGFETSVNAVVAMVEPGERLIVGLSTGKGSDTTVLMDMVKPKGSMWISMLKTRAGEKKFSTCFHSVKQKLVETTEEHDHSALLETLGFVSKVLSVDSATTRRLFLYSDMMQNSPAVSFYSIKPFDPDVAMKAVEKEYLVSQFKNVSVLVAGAGATVSDAMARRLEAFWKIFFEKSGGSLDFYGPVLLSSK